MNSKIIPTTIFVTGILLLLFSMNSTITGLSIVDTPTLDYALTHTTELQIKFNTRINDVPKSAKFLLGNEKILLKIDRLDGTTEKLSITTKRGAIIEITEQDLEDYTMNAHVTETTINKILDSENQVTAALDALNNKEIDITALTRWKRMKLSFSKFGVRTYGWFKK